MARSSVEVPGRRRSPRRTILRALIVLAVAIGAVGSVAYAIATPTSYWPAEGDANDAVGSNDGTLDGTGFAPGQQGLAFSFDGVDDLVDFGNTVANFGSGDFTLSFWIKTPELPSRARQSVLVKRPACGLHPLSWWDIRMRDTGQIQVELVGDDPFTYQNFATVSSLNDGDFHHYALVRQGTSLEIYVDGLLDFSVTTSDIANLDNATSMIAGRSPCTGVPAGNFDDGTEYFTGLLDEVRMHDSALTSEEVAALLLPPTTTVIVGDTDTGVEDRPVTDDATMNDLIEACEEDARNHGQFVSCVTRLTNEWRKAALITKAEERTIDTAAAQSDVGKP